jgi:hypothetical protein
MLERITWERDTLIRGHVASELLNRHLTEGKCDLCVARYAAILRLSRSSGHVTFPPRCGSAEEWQQHIDESLVVTRAYVRDVMGDDVAEEILTPPW